MIETEMRKNNQALITYLEKLKQNASKENLENKKNKIQRSFLRNMYSVFNDANIKQFIVDFQASNRFQDSRFCSDCISMFKGKQNFLEINWEEFDSSIAAAINLYEMLQGNKIENELILLNAIYPLDRGGMAWELPTFYLDYEGCEEEFPGLSVSFDFNKKHVGSGVIINIDDSTNFSARGDHPHPHVGEEGMICLGDGAASAQLLWEKKEIVSLVLLIIDILSNYNPDSPYIAIQDWHVNGTSCANCNTTVDEDDCYYVDGEAGCNECACWSEYHDRDFWECDAWYSSYMQDSIAVESAYIVYVDGIEDKVPEDVAYDKFSKCENCNNRVPNDELRERAEHVGNDEFTFINICSPCREDSVQLRQNDNLFIDPEISDDYFYCHECDSIKPEISLGQIICDDCSEEEEVVPYDSAA